MIPDPITCAMFLLIAFFLAGLIQSFWLRSSYSKWFKSPIDQGRSFLGRRIFGDNKTWSGFVAMVPGVGISFVVCHLLFSLIAQSSLDGLWTLSTAQFGLLGLVAGLGFMLGELPNSFFKRQFGVPPGKAPENRLAKITCFLVDRFDSILGAMLAMAFIVPMPPMTWLYIILIGPLMHLGFNFLLFQLRVKERPA